MHIYPTHDLVMVLTGGMCGYAAAIAVREVNRAVHTSEKDEGTSPCR
jgi:hypothetical protein